MEKRVQLFPGVIVSRSIALAVRFGTIDDMIYDGATALAESPEGLERIDDSEVAGIVKNVERFLREKQKEWGRRHNEFGPRKYHWRRDGSLGSRHYEGTRRPTPPLSTEISELYGGEPTKDDHLGTNQILEQILGLNDGSARTRFLMELVDGKYDGNYSKCFKGADIVRAAFHLAQFYGLMDIYSGNLQRRAKIFRAILDSVNKGSIQLTDALIDHFSLKEMPGLMSRYNPFRKLDALVPRKDAYTIDLAMETPGLMHLGGPALMSELGYKAIYHAGTPVLYYKPCTK